jgi:hypothetical protein
MFPPDQAYHEGRTQEALVALRGLLSQNPCAFRFGAETLSKLLYEERFLHHRVGTSEVECLLEALRVEGEVLG